MQQLVRLLDDRRPDAAMDSLVFAGRTGHGASAQGLARALCRASRAAKLAEPYPTLTTYDTATRAC